MPFNRLEHSFSVIGKAGTWVCGSKCLTITANDSVAGVNLPSHRGIIDDFSHPESLLDFVFAHHDTPLIYPDKGPDE